MTRAFIRYPRFQHADGDLPSEDVSLATPASDWPYLVGLPRAMLPANLGKSIPAQLGYLHILAYPHHKVFWSSQSFKFRWPGILTISELLSYCLVPTERIRKDHSHAAGNLRRQQTRTCPGDGTSERPPSIGR